MTFFQRSEPDRNEWLRVAFERASIADAPASIKSSDLFCGFPHLSTYLFLISQIGIDRIKLLAALAVNSLSRFAKKDGLDGVSANDHTGTFAYLGRLHLIVAETAIRRSEMGTKHDLATALRFENWMTRSSSVERFSGKPWASSQPHNPPLAVTLSSNDYRYLPRGPSREERYKSEISPLVLAAMKPGLDAELNVIAAFPKTLAPHVEQFCRCYEIADRSPDRIHRSERTYWYYSEGSKEYRVPGVVRKLYSSLQDGGGRESYSHELKFYEHMGQAFTRLHPVSGGRFPEVEARPIILHIRCHEFS